MHVELALQFADSVRMPWAEGPGDTKARAAFGPLMNLKAASGSLRTSAGESGARTKIQGATHLSTPAS